MPCASQLKPSTASLASAAHQQETTAATTAVAIWYIVDETRVRVASLVRTRTPRSRALSNSARGEGGLLSSLLPAAGAAPGRQSLPPGAR